VVLAEECLKDRRTVLVTAPQGSDLHGAVRGAVRARPETLGREVRDVELCAAKSLVFCVSRWLLLLNQHGGAERIGEETRTRRVARTLRTLSTNVEPLTALPQ
jgi:hypothetical protein